MAKASGRFFSSSLHSGSVFEFRYAEHSSSWEKEAWEENVPNLKVYLSEKVIISWSTCHCSLVRPTLWILDLSSRHRLTRDYMDLGYFTDILPLPCVKEEEDGKPARKMSPSRLSRAKSPDGVSPASKTLSQSKKTLSISSVCTLKAL